MKIVLVDSKRRVVLPKASPGDIMAVEEAHGCYTLTRVELPKGRRLSRRACLDAMERTPVKLAMDWDQLRKLTREP